jgi:hypothetical protein
MNLAAREMQDRFASAPPLSLADRNDPLRVATNPGN